eukprot:CAMPEP_0115376604 /NCGR_PEP_ID=MMETSP0271-20121206/3062_1 /TAXON_ID=71861 /ORGANISM="Scrippsiella trochoidea, Strain CCMP3099" /LENGTH=131 /DNA_ID=CAMNT_0002799701 /DNA_START=281 /DNA_END=676 /DNA_ORIENTATION=-
MGAARPVKPTCSSSGVRLSEGKSQIFKVLSAEAVSKRRGASSHLMQVTSSLWACIANEEALLSTSKITKAPLLKPTRSSREELAQATAVGLVDTPKICPVLRPHKPKFEERTAHKVNALDAAVNNVLEAAS